MKQTEACARSSVDSAEPAGTPGKSLVLGLGNSLISDDGFGPAVVEECRRRFHPVPATGPGGAAGRGRPAVDFVDAAAAGLRLLDLMAGYERALILDVVQSGRFLPGTLLDWPTASASNGRTLGGSHQCDLITAIALGKALGVPLPSEITLLVAEAADLLTIREELTPELDRAVPRAVALVGEWIERAGSYQPEEGENHAQARSLS